MKPAKVAVHVSAFVRMISGMTSGTPSQQTTFCQGALLSEDTQYGEDITTNFFDVIRPHKRAVPVAPEMSTGSNEGDRAQPVARPRWKAQHEYPTIMLCFPRSGGDSPVLHERKLFAVASIIGMLCVAAVAVLLAFGLG